MLNLNNIMQLRKVKIAKLQKLDKICGQKITPTEWRFVTILLRSFKSK